MEILKSWHVHYLIVKQRKHLLGHSTFSLMRGKLAEMDQLLRPIPQGSGAIIPSIATILNPRRSIQRAPF